MAKCEERHIDYFALTPSPKHLLYQFMVSQRKADIMLNQKQYAKQKQANTNSLEKKLSLPKSIPKDQIKISL